MRSFGTWQGGLTQEMRLRGITDLDQADEFLRLARDKSNHPMLVTCASANRVGAFMMILRVIDQGWSEEEALQEAVRIGLSSDNLKRFAHDYIASHQR